jgi:hypothetical protein
VGDARRRRVTGVLVRVTGRLYRGGLHSPCGGDPEFRSADS